MHFVLSSLLKQLIVANPNHATPVIEMHSKWESQQKAPQVEDLEQALCLIVKSLHLVFFVFDALDECDSAQRKMLLRILGRLSLAPNTKVFVTSRSHLKDELGKFQVWGTEGVKALDASVPQIEVTAADSDLRPYIRSKIEESDNLGLLDDDFISQIVEKIISRARRMLVTLSPSSKVHMGLNCSQVPTRCPPNPDNTLPTYSG